MSFQFGWKYFPFNEIKLDNYLIQESSIRIVQLSDLHLKKSVKLSYLISLVEQINKLEVDIVVFTGDILQTKAYKLKEHIEIFSKIKAKSYYVTGNHDIFYGSKELKILMDKSNIECLDNTISTILINGISIQFVGLSDRYSFILGERRKVKELFSKLDSTLFTILLAHQPKDIEYIMDNRIDIQLSGHTHGGQIYPFNKLVKLFQPYFSGKYIYNKTYLYVTNGVGYWGISLRYKAPSEIPIFTIS